MADALLETDIAGRRPTGSVANVLNKGEYWR